MYVYIQVVGGGGGEGVVVGVVSYKVPTYK
jgi:hypothetical protein